MNRYTTGRVWIDASQGIAKATIDAYETLIGIANSTGQYIAHVRNFVPSILASAGNRRNVYQEFCEARKAVFDSYGVTDYPSACAVGGSDGLNVLYTLSTEKPTRLSSPTQTDPEKYPSHFGTPLFSRASQIGTDLFVSGTASIEGSETIHVGDVQAQTRTTIETILSIISASNTNMRQMEFIAYVKYIGDIPVVGSILAGYGINPTFKRTDICRENLLVEIEALPRSIA